MDVRVAPRFAGLAAAWALSCARSEPAPPPRLQEAVTVPPEDPAPGAVSWRALQPGLDFAEVLLPEKSSVGDSTLRVLRIDPARWALSLQMASASGGRPRTAEAWLDASNGVAAINAAMFAEDFTRSVGWMSRGEHLNSDRWAPEQNSLLALDPVRPDLPAFHLYNLGCVSRAEAEARYRTRVQSIRMHGLIDLLRALPLDLRALHYGEGGPEATLAVRTPALTETWVGSWETGFNENDDYHLHSDLPNVIVVQARGP